MSVADNQLSSSLVNIRSEHAEELVDIPLDELIVDIEQNRRDTKDTYEKTHPEMAGLIQNMVTYGWAPGKRLLVSKRANGTKRVLQGHRRATAARHAGLTSVPCLVFTGLTPDQETAVIVDGGEAPIGKIGHFREVQMLMRTGLVGRKPIAIKTGLLQKKKPTEPRTEVQEYMELVELPKVVRDIWVDGQRGDPVPFTVDASRRRELYMAMLRDRQGLTLDAEGNKVEAYDNGVRRIGTWEASEGIEFNAVFNRLLTTGVTAKKKQQDSAVNSAGLEGMGKSIDQPDLKNLFFGLSGKNDYSTSLKKITTTMERHNALVDLTKDVTNPIIRLLVFGAAISEEKDYREAMAKVIEIAVAACDDHAMLNDFTLPACSEPIFTSEATAYEGKLPSEEIIEEPVAEKLPKLSPEDANFGRRLGFDIPTEFIRSDEPVAEEPVSEPVVSDEPVVSEPVVSAPVATKATKSKSKRN